MPNSALSLSLNGFRRLDENNEASSVECSEPIDFRAQPMKQVYSTPSVPENSRLVSVLTSRAGTYGLEMYANAPCSNARLRTLGLCVAVR